MRYSHASMRNQMQILYKWFLVKDGKSIVVKLFCWLLLYQRIVQYCIRRTDYIIFSNEVYYSVDLLWLCLEHSGDSVDVTLDRIKSLWIIKSRVGSRNIPGFSPTVICNMNCLNVKQDNPGQMKTQTIHNTSCYLHQQLMHIKICFSSELSLIRTIGWKTIDKNWDLQDCFIRIPRLSWPPQLNW